MDHVGSSAVDRLRKVALFTALGALLVGCDETATAPKRQRQLSPQQRAALQKLLPKAEAGNADAIFDTAALLTDDEASDAEFNDGIAWLEKSARRGDSRGQGLLGLFCTWGWRTLPKDCRRGLHLLNMAATSRNANAIHAVGLSFYEGQCVERDFAEARKWFLRGASKGSSESENYLGMMYSNAEGVDRDYSKAFYWFKRSADQDNAYGINNLGACYHNGEGVARDISKALELYDKAAAKGNALGAKNARELRRRLLARALNQ